MFCLAIQNNKEKGYNKVDETNRLGLAIFWPIALFLFVMLAISFVVEMIVAYFTDENKD